jgi:hypothetical protein
LTVNVDIRVRALDFLEKLHWVKPRLDTTATYVVEDRGTSAGRPHIRSSYSFVRVRLAFCSKLLSMATWQLEITISGDFGQSQ